MEADGKGLPINRIQIQAAGSYCVGDGLFVIGYRMTNQISRHSALSRNGGSHKRQNAIQFEIGTKIVDRS